MKNILPFIPMRNTPFLWILLMSIMLSASSCKKEKVVEPEPDLPPLTTTGRMTFGCYVNGEPWVAEVPPFQPYYRPTGGGIQLDSTMLIFANLINQSRDETIYLPFSIPPAQSSFINNIWSNHSNRLYNNYNNSCNNVKGDYYYDLDTSYINEVVVANFDLDNHIISGTFEMRVISRKCKDTILFTDGRFDVKFSIIEE